MNRELVERLRALLVERLGIGPEAIKLSETPSIGEWCIRVEPIKPRLRIYISLYEDGRIEVVSGSMHTSEAIGDTLYTYKYDRRLKRAKTEEKEGIREEAWREERTIVKDFIRKKFEKHLKGAIAYFAKQYMWCDELARRLSEKYGFELKFIVENEDTGFRMAFNSVGMGEEQVIQETVRRAEALREVEMMYKNEEMMNEFLASRGIEVKNPSRRKHTS